MCQAHTPQTSAQTPSSTTDAPASSQGQAHGCGCGCGAKHAAATDASAQVGTVGPMVHSLKEALSSAETVRWVGASHDMDFPPVPFPSRRVLDEAGETLIRALVWRQHTLLRTSPIGHLFAPDDAGFAAGTQHAADFAVEACGGPSRYSEQRGHTCMRTRHFPFTIDEAGRETWLCAMWQAFHDVGFPVEVREEYWNWVEAMSIRMVNRRTQKAQPDRLPYEAMLGRPVQVDLPATASGT